jgi:iron complex transport system permease protein
MLDLRLPRIVLAIITGAALSTAGASFQGTFRNPLAEPYLLGVSAGAALGATIAIVWKPIASFGIYTLPLLAFVGACLAAFLVYRLATFGGRTQGASLLLSGVAVGSTLTAILSFLMVTTERDLHTVVVWLMGGLTAATWNKVFITLPVVAVGFIYMMLMARRMNLLLMGEERAQELGVDSQATRRNLMIAASLTTAAAVAFTGLIGFVGLMVPHIMRLLVGPDHRRLLPASALFGALLLLIADTVARTALAPAEIPVGIITAAAGGPFFLYLLRRRKGA